MSIVQFHSNKVLLQCNHCIRIKQYVKALFNVLPEKKNSFKYIAL